MFGFRLGLGLFSSPPRADQLWVSPSLLSNGYRGSTLGEKRPRSEADNPPPSSVEVKNMWSYTSIPQIRLHGAVLN